MKQTNTLVNCVLAATLTYGAAAAADHRVDYDYADVISATPIVRTYEISRPETECWHEPVERYERGEGNLGGVILGGIVGGVIGSRFGGGDGRRAATVIGSVAGAAVGHEMSRGPGHVYSDSERHCQTVRSRHTEERVIGYDVHYRYNGRDFYTRTDRDPGERIKIRVAVTPVE